MTTALTMQRGDAGAVHRIEIVDLNPSTGKVELVDVSSASGATEKQIKFRAPDGTVTTRNAAFTTDGTDGLIEYVTTPADIVGAVAGDWKRQAYLELATWQGHAAAEHFHVLHNVD